MVHSRIMAKEQEVASVERLVAEGGIASDESAVEEPEIEADEGSVEEHVKEPDESSVWKGGDGEVGCPIRMGAWSYSPRCGRKLHVAPDGVDEKTVCLMHSKDPGKQLGPLCDAFWLEFEKVLEEAGESAANFEHFVFPPLDFRSRKFLVACKFSHATFTKDAFFSNATFACNADFSFAIFAQDAMFVSATFMMHANFFKAIFKQEAHYYHATFMQSLNFNCATFMRRANFGHTIFKQKAEFAEATFTRDADFSDTVFTQDAYFSAASFSENTIFDSATFEQHADFLYVVFTLAARFEYTRFYGTAKWQNSRFLDRAHFRNTMFDPKILGKPSAVFELASFSKPGEIVFDNVDLSRAIFHNCDVSQVWFTSSVKWGKRQDNHGLAVFEETFEDTLPLDDVAWGILYGGGQRYRAVAQIYQQLKKNYDSRLDYWTANEFHFGEMEMKRLAGPINGPLLWLRRWWHRNFSFVAWYKYASDYGNSYGKPLLWLLGTLLAAALLFPITGLELKQPISGNAANSARVTYSSEWDKNNSWTNKFWAEAKLIGKSGITAIDTATFQRTPEYAPAYPCGRVVAIFETLLTSSLFALFLLAIRRQFRR